MLTNNNNTSGMSLSKILPQTASQLEAYVCTYKTFHALYKV